MSMKMPTAQSSSTSSSLQNNTKNSKKNVDNKIAKAAAKVAAERGSSGGSQENTRATTPDQQGQQQQQQQQAPQATGGVKTPQEQPEFIKQSLIVIEKKVRNLEKRRTKLEEYRDIQAKGTPLNDDQLAAISRYDEVCRTLELSRELEKQFIGLANDAMKQQKKQLKKEQMEREEAVREKLKESQKVLALLNSFGDETVRNDFLNELNGASKVSELELNALDEFNKIVQPANEISSRLESISNESAEHIYNLIEAKNKQIAQLSAQVVGAAFTYADLKKLFDRIFSSAYWQQRELNLASSSTAAAETPVETATTNEQQADTQQQQIDAHLSEQIGQLNMNVEQQSQQQNDVHHHSNIPLEQVYHQQNTSEDYILVSAQSDVSGGDASGQNKASRTFFSTLNPQDRNINEFLNRESNEEGINFLQDSEIQSNQAQQQHQVHEQQHQVEHHHQQQQAPHQHQQHLDNQHPQGGQGFQTYQEFGQNEHYKDSRGPRRDYNGPRNQHQNNNGGNAHYPPQQQRPRYQDGGPRRGGGQNGGVIPNQQQPRSNVDRNGGGGGGYRGGNRGGMGGGQRTGGGEYRGGNYSSGPRQGGAGGQQQQRYPPRQQQPADQN